MKDSLIYRSENPTVNDYLELRVLVGWGEMPLNVVDKALKNNVYSICAYSESNQIVGTARIVGDGGLCYYIQDVMVRPSFQNKGIATVLLTKIMEYLQHNAPHNSYVGLMSAKGLEPFYSKFGFMLRPNEYMGSGMIQFWGRGTELTES